MKEARRLETQTRNMLLDGRRLSLIVDLDQTIIHTTVDPTVGEWMMEIEEEESEERTHEQLGFSDRKGEVKIPVGDERGGDEGSQSNGHTTTPLTSTEQSTSKKPFREKNPNAAALKDVARFQLADDLRLGYKGLETGRWYYTKPRCAESRCLPFRYLAPHPPLSQLTLFILLGQALQIFWNQCLGSTRCTCTPWVRGAMQMLSAQSSILLGPSSAAGFSAGMRAAASVFRGTCIVR